MPKVIIRAIPNGPYEVSIEGKPVAYLCRCGHSSNKPYCDGSHKQAGFTAPETQMTFE
ncbi:CDGSH iron-sulfur domain-containing protein [Pyrobaculum aerophilum]|uniref:CDGSH iron-sulfur domain-containing protein n=1 Tax=Pyrobaculum aerophilum TaxID=13773 RepID=UPI0023F1985B|nr:CDGSH iron-sulfur domain-containing protein [Pyrobaculum aerophilum]MCX8136680.1 CDGSH iron-sulfur domain-containing protein [Pyrobaculum aerophilum]